MTTREEILKDLYETHNELGQMFDDLNANINEEYFDAQLEDILKMFLEAARDLKQIIGEG